METYGLKVKNKRMVKAYWVYILQCRNGAYYTGYTRDLSKRYQSHLDGTASKYTRSFKPVRLARAWQITGNQSLAMKVECYIKKLSRLEKEKIIAQPALLPLNLFQADRLTDTV